jgi:hypothetical protein
MNAKNRLDAIEDRIGNNDKGCTMIVRYWNPDTKAALKDPKCPNGYGLSRDLHECTTCSVPEKNRHHIKLIMVGADGKPVKELDPLREV